MIDWVYRPANSTTIFSDADKLLDVAPPLLNRHHGLTDPDWGTRPSLSLVSRVCSFHHASSHNGISPDETYRALHFAA